MIFRSIFDSCKWRLRYAIEEKHVQEGVFVERPGGDSGGQAAEAGSGDCVCGEAESGEEEVDSTHGEKAFHHFRYRSVRGI